MGLRNLPPAGFMPVNPLAGMRLQKGNQKDGRNWQQKTRDWLNDKGRQMLGPHGDAIFQAGQTLSQFSDAADLTDAASYGADLGRSVQNKDWMGAAKAAPWMLAATAASMLPGVSMGPADNVAKETGEQTVKGFKAYHGSPHSFDRFDMSKIGTGEGAQAYGHGLYFADSEGVAKSYRDQLKRGDNNSIVHIGDREFPSDMGNYYLRQETERLVPVESTKFLSGKETYDFYNKELGDAAYKALKKASPTDDPVAIMSAAMDEKIAKLSPYDDELPSVLAMKNATIEYAKNNIKLSPNGSMYEVQINADPNSFLDWDKPLSEQPDIARQLGWTDEQMAAYQGAQSQDDDALLAALTGDANYSATRLPVPQGLPPLSATGGDIVKGNSVFDRASDAVKSQALKEKGIPGIKYLDAGSRTKGDGSRNYVVFDDNLINILRKYGIAALPAGLGAASYLSQSQPADAKARMARALNKGQY